MDSLNDLRTEDNDNDTTRIVSKDARVELHNWKYCNMK